MSQVSVTVKTDEKVKKEFNSFCEELGLNMSTAINLFMRAVLREQRIPFDLALDKDPFYNKKNLERLEKSIRQMEETGGTIHEVDYD